MSKSFKVVMIDDNEDDMILVREMFEDAGFLGDLVEFKGAEEAWRYLVESSRHPSEFSIGLILLDINMPIKNGFEFLLDLKKDLILRGVPAVMLSGSSREEENSQALELGAFAYVTKPLHFDAFVGVLRELPVKWALSKK